MRTLTLAAALTLAACAAPPPPQMSHAPATVAAPAPSYARAPLTARGGIHYVQIGIAGVCCFPFALDTGASDVTVSPELFRAMVNGGHVTKDDLIDVQRYRTASGHVIEGLRFRMPPMQIAGRTVYGVVASVSPGTSNHAMLLGMSFLKKFRAFAVDHAAGVLVLG